MIDDVKPPAKPSGSLRDKLDSRNSEVTADPTPSAQSDEVFKTPEEVAAGQTLETPTTENSDTKTPPPSKRQSKLALHWPPGKKEWLSLLVVLLLIGGGIGGWVMAHPKAKPPVVVKKAAVVAPKVVVPTTVASTLTGLQVDPSLNKGPVTGVMIENSLDARPQAGLSQAGVVFEAIAEAGITRFLALYQDTAPDNVGPIRSARPYYVQWLLGFDAAYAHVGGSPEAISDIQAWGVHDLNQFYNGSYYHRISARAAPHNVYTAIATLNQLEAKKGYTTSSYSGFPRKAETPAKVPTARTINLNISGPTYNVAYTYDPATNSYMRNQAGAPHIDANTNTQIKPKVVIALVMSYSLEADGYHSAYGVIGSGPVYVFQDGLVTAGTWTKTSSTSQITFADSNGATIKLNPGQTWLTAVAKTSDVISAP